MRRSILLAVFLSIHDLTLGTACGRRNVGPTETAHTATLGIATADTEAMVLAEDPEGATIEEEHTESMNLDLVAGALPVAIEPAKPHPLANLSNAEVESMLLGAPETLGAASLGRPSSGALYGGIVMPAGPQWNIVNTQETWGTHETIGFLSHTIARVNKLFPKASVINIGDISRASGGHLKPHLSHQAGRDVDIGFYYKDASKWYSSANASNLDMARTWAFIKITITETDIEAIFIDRKLQKLFRTYALELGEDPQWLDAIFGGPTSTLRPILLHEPGHKTHLHLRYYNPIAQETGRRIYKTLIKHQKIKPPTYYVKYKVKRGDTLNKIAKKLKTTVSIIKKANKLRGNRIYANRTYKIPKKGGVVQPKKLTLPARRLPTPTNQVSK